MAKDKPQAPESPAEKAAAFLAKRKEKYDAAYENAMAAKATTDTPSWRINYQANLKAHHAVIRENTDAITEACRIIGLHDTSENKEKDIKDAVKAMVEERESHQAWLYRAVLPYSSRVEECERIASEAVSAAYMAEDRSPLTTRGLGDAVRKAVRAWPKVGWDEKTGTVTAGAAEASAESKAA